MKTTTTLLALALALAQAQAVQVPVTRRYVYDATFGGDNACAIVAPHYVSLRNEGPTCTAVACGAGATNETRASVDCLHSMAYGLGAESDTAGRTYVVTFTGYAAADCSDEAPFGGAILASNECVYLEPEGGRGEPLYARALCTAGVPTLYLCHNDATCRECLLYRGAQCQDFSAHSPGFGQLQCVDV